MSVMCVQIRHIFIQFCVCLFVCLFVCLLCCVVLYVWRVCVSKQGNSGEEFSFLFSTREEERLDDRGPRAA